MSKQLWCEFCPRSGGPCGVCGPRGRTARTGGIWRGLAAEMVPLLVLLASGFALGLVAGRLGLWW